MADWPALEDRVSQAIRTSPLGEPVTYTPHDDDAVEIRAAFNLEGTSTDLASGVRYATDNPTLEVRDADIGRAPEVGDQVSVAGTDYDVVEVRPGARGWSVCQLHEG